MRKRENKESIGETSQGLLIKQKKCSKKNRELYFQKQNKKKPKEKQK